MRTLETRGEKRQREAEEGDFEKIAEEAWDDVNEEPLPDIVEVTSSPELPLGRRAVSMSNSSPAEVRSVSQLTSLRAKAR